jgi:hypothetical protein
MLLYIEYYNYTILYNGMWCGYRKLRDYLCLTVFVDSSLMSWFYFPVFRRSISSTDVIVQKFVNLL